MDFLLYIGTKAGAGSPWLHAALSLALLLAAAKAAGRLCSKWNQPAVLGEILAGILVGPSLLGWVGPNILLNHVGFIGVVLLMFIAGLETETEVLKRVLGSAFLVALIGVAMPLIGGYGLGRHLGFSNEVSLMLGTILVSTSVSISVQVLKEMEKLGTLEGTTILGAAVIDDFFGFLLLTFILAMLVPGAPPVHPGFLGILAFKLGAFAGLALAGKFLLSWVIEGLEGGRTGIRWFLIILLLAFAFLYAFLAKSAGLSAIVGAYLIGMLLGPTVGRTAARRTRLAVPIERIGYAVFIPVFFAGIGLHFDAKDMDLSLAGFAVTLATVAILTKIAGGMAGAWLSGRRMLPSFQIGIGMIPRGEVALVVAMIAFHQGIIGDDLLSVIVLVIVLTTLLTPFLLKAAFSLQNESG